MITRGYLSFIKLQTREYKKCQALPRFPLVKEKLKALLINSLTMFEIREVEVDAIRSRDPTLKNYDKEKVKEMAQALAKDGQKEPIVTDPELTVIWKGHTRYLAAKQLGWKKIKAILLTGEQWNEAMMSGQITP